MPHAPQEHAEILALINTHRVRIAAGGAALLLFGLMVWKQSFGGLLLLGPTIVGCLVIAIASEATNKWIDLRSSTYQRLADWAAPRHGKFARYFVRPVAHGSAWTWSQTASLADGNLRAGIRTAIALYFWVLMIGLLLTALYVIVVLIMIALVIVVIGWALSIGGATSSSGARSSSVGTLLNARGSGKSQKFYDKTGIFSEDEAGRIDDDGNLYKKTGVFSEEMVGRVDEDGGIHKKTGLFSEEQTHRVAEDGRIYQKTGIFSEEEVGRVADDGRTYKKTGIFSEEEVGRIEDVGN